MQILQAQDLQCVATFENSRPKSGITKVCHCRASIALLLSVENNSFPRVYWLKSLPATYPLTPLRMEAGGDATPVAAMPPSRQDYDESADDLLLPEEFTQLSINSPGNTSIGIAMLLLLLHKMYICS